MNNALRRLGRFRQTDIGQIPAHERRTATNMRPRVFSPVAFFGIADPAQITNIMKQRSHGTDQEHLLAQNCRTLGTCKSVHQTRHGQRNLKNMLDIVILGFAGVITGKFTAIHAADIGKNAQDARRKLAPIDVLINLRDRKPHR